MKIAVLDAAALGDDIDLSPLAAVGEVTAYPSTAPDKVAERLQGVFVAVVNKVRLNGSSLQEAHDLKLICVAATGYDNIDVAYCRERGIALCNVPGYSTDSVAQLTVAMALSLATHLKEYRQFVDSGEYSVSGIANRLVPVYHELSSLTWGVVGGGNIASRVAGIASKMGCSVLMCRRRPDDRYEQVDMDGLCRQANIISLHVPLTPETRGLINRERLALMRPTTLLINVARGAVMDEQAVAEAICEGRLGGLGADVYSDEPFGEKHPFYSLRGRDNVCLTPHMAWGSAEARHRCVKMMAENIRTYVAGGIKNRIV